MNSSEKRRLETVDSEKNRLLIERNLRTTTIWSNLTRFTICCLCSVINFTTITNITRHHLRLLLFHRNQDLIQFNSMGIY
jgi:hypothetical protein